MSIYSDIYIYISVPEYNTTSYTGKIMSIHLDIYIYIYPCKSGIHHKRGKITFIHSDICIYTYIYPCQSRIQHHILGKFYLYIRIYICILSASEWWIEYIEHIYISNSDEIDASNSAKFCRTTTSPLQNREQKKRIVRTIVYGKTIFCNVFFIQITILNFVCILKKKKFQSFFLFLLFKFSIHPHLRMRIIDKFE